MSISINHTTRTIPRGRFKAIARDILGDDFELSIVFVGATRAQKLNQSTRGKDYIPNVLSFPLGRDAGEIFICPDIAAKEASDFGLTPTHYLEYLCIHGCLHVQGYDHGPTMDKLESKYRREFGINTRE